MPDITELERLYKKYNILDRQYLTIDNGNDEFRFSVKCRLDKDDVVNMVRDVCAGVFDKRTGEYHPELKDYYLRVAVIKAYTDIALPPDDSSWRLVYGTPIFAMVTGHCRRPVEFGGRDYDDNMVIDVEQYEQIISSIDNVIAHAMEIT